MSTNASLRASRFHYKKIINVKNLNEAEFGFSNFSTIWEEWKGKIRFITLFCYSSFWYFVATIRSSSYVLHTPWIYDHMKLHFHGEWWSIYSLFHKRSLTFWFLTIESWVWLFQIFLFGCFLGGLCSGLFKRGRLAVLILILPTVCVWWCLCSIQQFQNFCLVTCENGIASRRDGCLGEDGPKLWLHEPLESSGWSFCIFL